MHHYEETGPPSLLKITNPAWGGGGFSDHDVNS